MRRKNKTGLGKEIVVLYKREAGLMPSKKDKNKNRKKYKKLNDYDMIEENDKD